MNAVYMKCFMTKLKKLDQTMLQSFELTINISSNSMMLMMLISDFEYFFNFCTSSFVSTWPGSSSTGSNRERLMRDEHRSSASQNILHVEKVKDDARRSLKLLLQVLRLSFCQNSEMR